MKTETIPVVIAALGLIKKGLKKHTEKIPGAISINELQKLTLLGTAHIVRKVLSLSAKSISPALPQDHGLDSALQEKIKNSRIVHNNKNNNNTNNNNNNNTNHVLT